MASRLCWFGLQNTASKRREGSTNLGTWTGSIRHISKGLCISFGDETE